MTENTPRERSNDVISSTENAHADVEMNVCGEVKGRGGLGDESREHVGAVENLRGWYKGSECEGSDMGELGVERVNANAGMSVESNVERDRDGDVVMRERVSGPTDDEGNGLGVEGRAEGGLEGKKRAVLGFAMGEANNFNEGADNFDEANAFDDDGDAVMR